jgi:hypothetical protein
MRLEPHRWSGSTRDWKDWRIEEREGNFLPRLEKK